MPRQLVERRDSTVLNHLIEIKAELSANTAETKAQTEQLKTLNGKVAGHETRLQSLEVDKALNNKRNESEDRQVDYKTQVFRRWTDRLVWGAFLLFLALFYYLLTNNGFPNFIK